MTRLQLLIALRLIARRIGWESVPPRPLIERVIEALRSRHETFDEFITRAEARSELINANRYYVNGPMRIQNIEHRPGFCQKFIAEDDKVIARLGGPYLYRANHACTCT